MDALKFFSDFNLSMAMFDDRRAEFISSIIMTNLRSSSVALMVGMLFSLSISSLTHAYVGSGLEELPNENKSSSNGLLLWTL